MRKIRKVMALLLTLAMVMGMSLTTFAADQTTITVNELDAGASISYLQVVEPDRGSTIGWKFCGSPEDLTIANAFMTAFGVTSEEEALNALINLAITGVETGENINKYAKAGDINTNSDLAEALTALEDDATKTVGVSGNQISVTAAGLYLIVATPASGSNYDYIPMLAYVKDNGLGELQPVAVTAKGSNITIEKSLDDDDDQSVSEGDQVAYTAEVEYPYYSAEETDKIFTATDTVTGGTYMADSLTVSIVGGKTLAAGTDYTVTPYANASEFTINFNYNGDYAGEKIEIHYTVRVGAGETDLGNTIVTNFDETGDSTKSDKVEVLVTKTDNANENLGGATLAIYEAAENDNDEEYIKYENVSVVQGDILVDSQDLYLKEIATQTDTDDGLVIFKGLDAQKTYYVKEVTAPKGYSVNPNYYLLSGAKLVSGDGTNDTYVFNNFDDVTVTDDNLAALPSTGGIGTTIFTIGGCVIMIAAAGLYFASRRKHGEN